MSFHENFKREKLNVSLLAKRLDWKILLRSTSLRPGMRRLKTLNEVISLATTSVSCFPSQFLSALKKRPRMIHGPTYFSGSIISTGSSTLQYVGGLAEAYLRLSLWGVKSYVSSGLRLRERPLSFYRPHDDAFWDRNLPFLSWKEPWVSSVFFWSLNWVDH